MKEIGRLVEKLADRHIQGKLTIEFITLIKGKVTYRLEFESKDGQDEEHSFITSADSMGELMNRFRKSSESIQ